MNFAAGTSSAASAVCPACLGVLQSAEGALHAVPSAMLAGLPEAEGNAGSWQTCTSATPHSLFQCVRSVCLHEVLTLRLISQLVKTGSTSSL